MDEFGLTHWILFTLIPLIITIYSILSKISKDKLRQENRITEVEKDVKKHDDTLKMINVKLEKQSEEFKTLHELKAQSDLMFKMVKD
ncbi:hypothetical protein BU107_07080, partial [Staphylococcus xylosus]|uniref:DUF7365 family protein n=1 Tax=Staphylococcus xylosus TaxID=1288 RepID=UPI000FF3B81A